MSPTGYRPSHRTRLTVLSDAADGMAGRGRLVASFLTTRLHSTAITLCDQIAPRTRLPCKHSPGCARCTSAAPTGVPSWSRCHAQPAVQLSKFNSILPVAHCIIRRIATVPLARRAWRAVSPGIAFDTEPGMTSRPFLRRCSVLPAGYYCPRYNLPDARRANNIIRIPRRCSLAATGTPADAFTPYRTKY
jgi:hypothetical protein